MLEKIFQEFKKKNPKIKIPKIKKKIIPKIKTKSIKLDTL